MDLSDIRKQIEVVTESRNSVLQDRDAAIRVLLEETWPRGMGFPETEPTVVLQSSTCESPLLVNEVYYDTGEKCWYWDDIHEGILLTTN